MSLEQRIPAKRKQHSVPAALAPFILSLHALEPGPDSYRHSTGLASSWAYAEGIFPERPQAQRPTSAVARPGTLASQRGLAVLDPGNCREAVSKCRGRNDHICCPSCAQYRATTPPPSCPRPCSGSQGSLLRGAALTSSQRAPAGARQAEAILSIHLCLKVKSDKTVLSLRSSVTLRL